MTVVNPTTPQTAHRAHEEEAWVGDLRSTGLAGHEAQLRLQGLLLRATRHQVRRLRQRLPGAGAADLEDLAQQAADDALVAVLGKLDTFEGRSRFSTWVYKFGVLHAGVAVRREAWRHREVALPGTLDPPDRGATAAAMAEASDLSRAVRAAIGTDLTPHQRRVTLALLVDRMPIDVLAERLGTNRNALYKTLHDARQRLRACLISSGHLEKEHDGSTS